MTKKRRFQITFFKLKLDNRIMSNIHSIIGLSVRNKPVVPTCLISVIFLFKKKLGRYVWTIKPFKMNHHKLEFYEKVSTVLSYSKTTVS